MGADAVKRVTPNELRDHLAVQLTVLPPYVRRELQLRNELAVKHAVDRLMERVFSGMIVLAPDPVMNAMHVGPGRFGVTEPDPFPIDG